MLSGCHGFGSQVWGLGSRFLYGLGQEVLGRTIGFRDWGFWGAGLEVKGLEFRLEFDALLKSTAQALPYSSIAYNAMRKYLKTTSIKSFLKPCRTVLSTIKPLVETLRNRKNILHEALLNPCKPYRNV